MIDLNIPGHRQLRLSHLVLDFNGTLAQDGLLQDGVQAELAELSKLLAVHVVTGDTYGTAARALHGLPCQVLLLDPERQAEAKREIVCRLGAQQTAAIGNGRNDTGMLQVAALAIAVLGQEGAAREALMAAHIVAGDISSALGMLLHPRRLMATLRS